MLIRLTNKGKPFYVNNDYIESIEGETSGDKSLSTICMHGGPSDVTLYLSGDDYDQHGIHYTNTTPDEVAAEINRQIQESHNKNRETIRKRCGC